MCFLFHDSERHSVEDSHIYPTMHLFSVQKNFQQVFFSTVHSLSVALLRIYQSLFYIVCETSSVDGSPPVIQFARQKICYVITE